MTETEAKKIRAEYQHYLLVTLNVLWLNNKLTEKEYSRIRDRILGDKEVTN